MVTKLRKRTVSKKVTPPTLFPDKKLQDSFERFLQEESQNVSTQELAQHGGILDQVSPLDNIGAFNPDRITIDTYDKMSINPQINAGLNLIKLPIIGQNWHVECKEKPEIADAAMAMLKPLWLGLISASLTCVNYGFAAFEEVYERQGDLTNYRKIKSLHPQWIRIRTDKKDNFAGITQTFHSDNIPIPLNKSLIITHAKGDSFGNLFGTSRLVPIYETWYWWVSIMQFMLRYFEKKGTPPVIVSFPPGKSRDGVSHADTALAMGKAVISESVVALSSSLYAGGTERERRKWGIDFLTDDKRGEMFITALSFLDAKLLRGLFIPERVFTQDVSGKAGSYSLSKVHADMFMLGEEALIVDIEAQIDKYVIRRWVDINFGANAPECNLKIERITDARKVFLKDVFMEMVKKGTAIPAVKQIADVIGVPLDENGNAITDPEKQKEELRKKQELEKEKEEAKENKECGCGHKVELQDSKGRFWREPTRHENVKVLTEIEDTLNERQEEFKVELTQEILNPQIDQIVRRVNQHFENDKPLTDIWFNTVTILNTNGEEVKQKIPWLPMRSPLISKLKNFMKEFHIFGQETAIEEIGVDDKVVLNKETNDIIRAKSIAVGDRYLSNLKYQVQLIMLVPNNKTQQDIVSEIRGRIRDIMITVHIDKISEQESMAFLNSGRAFVVRRNS